MGASVAALLQHMVRGPAIARYTTTRTGVQRSELTKVARRLFRIGWQPYRADYLDLDRPVPHSRREQVDTVLAAVEPRLIEIAGLTAAVLAEVERQVRTRGLPLRCDAVSGRATSAASSHLIDGGVVDEVTAATLAALVIARATRAARPTGPDEPLTPSAFAESLSDAYDACWHTVGERHLADHPPSRLLLGADRRPDLTHRAVTPDNHLSGTDRCVFHRYHLVKDLTPDDDPALPRPKVPYRSEAKRCRHPGTLRPLPRDVAREEVTRACAPFGLDHPGHQRALTAVHNGVVLPPAEGDSDPAAVAARASFRTVTTSCLLLDESTDEQTVSQAVTGLLDRTVQPSSKRRRSDDDTPRPDGLSLVDTTVNAHTLAGQPDRVTLVLVRRTWLAMHSFEVHLAEPMCSCSLIAALRTAIQRAVPDALRHHRTQLEDALNRYAPAIDEAGPGTPALEAAQACLDRENATSTLLLGAPDAKDILLLTPGWRARYVTLVRQEPTRYLSADDFRDWCLGAVPGARTDTEE